MQYLKVEERVAAVISTTKCSREVSNPLARVWKFVLTDFAAVENLEKRKIGSKSEKLPKGQLSCLVCLS